MTRLTRTIQLALLSLLALSAPLSLAGCGDDGAPATDAGVDAGDSARPPGDAALDAPAGDAGDTDGGVGCAVEALCAADEIIVDVSWLEGHLGAAGVQVIDVRGASDHAAARIPGALRVSVDDLRTTVDGVPGQVVSESAAEAVFRAAGVRDDGAIIVYDAAVTTTAARLVWTFEYFGHDRVALLDGGFAAWDDGSRATDTGPATVSPSEYVVAGVVAERRVDAEYIAARLDPPTLGLVDARGAGEYATGHIPGALSVDWNRNVSSAGVFYGETELAALYASLDGTATTVAYCQTGSRASVAYVVLRSLGFDDVRLYDGSWAEWGSRPDLPQEP